MREQGITLHRDEGSGALTGTWQQKGKSHTLWYADATTLALWRDAFGGAFAGIDLFRLAGNSLQDLRDQLLR